MRISSFKNKKFIQQYKKKPIAHTYITFPGIFKVLGNIKNKKILDLGCGAGDFSRLLVQKNAQVTAIDYSKAQIEICKHDNADLKNFKCMVADATDLKQIKNNSYDFVIMSMVFISVPNKQKVARIFKEVSRVLKKSGQLVFTDLHPLGLMIEKTTTETNKPLPGFSYFKEGSKFSSEVILTDYSKIKFVDYHYTLGTYTDLLKKAKLYIEKIVEPQPINKSPKLFKNYKVPEYIICVCKKLI
jgi:ubiquinone/menaquinone biosynthesis C-methylase UbiE